MSIYFTVIFFGSAVKVNCGVEERLVRTTYRNLIPLCFTSRIIHIFKGATRIECTLTNCGYAFGKVYACKGVASIECIITNRG